MALCVCIVCDAVLTRSVLSVYAYKYSKITNIWKNQYFLICIPCKARNTKGTTFQINTAAKGRHRSPIGPTLASLGSLRSLESLAHRRSIAAIFRCISLYFTLYDTQVGAKWMNIEILAANKNERAKSEPQKSRRESRRQWYQWYACDVRQSITQWQLFVYAFQHNAQCVCVCVWLNTLCMGNKCEYFATNTNSYCFSERSVHSFW